ncbi:MAG: invasion associated locus B family protein [Rhodobacteraceae bacterium]|nr:invasion associated locus B family protein [Paracoccaceae bacterium]
MTWKTLTALVAALSMANAAPLLAQAATASDEAAPAESAPADAGAADQAAAAPSAPLWLVSCSSQIDPERLFCEFSQSIVTTEGNQRVATASFTRMAGETETNAAFVLPTGVLLPAGVSVSVDDANVGELIYQSCDAQGCYASGSVDDAWLEAMRSGTTLLLDLKTRDGQDVRLGFPLDQFSKAEAMLP